MTTEPYTYTHDDIQINAYYRWENAGRPEGRDLEFWLAAEDHFQRTALAMSLMQELEANLLRIESDFKDMMAAELASYEINESPSTPAMVTGTPISLFRRLKNLFTRKAK